MKEFVFWKESIMLTQKFLRTWQIYLSLTCYSSLLEASVTDSSSNLSDAHVGDGGSGAATSFTAAGIALL